MNRENVVKLAAREKQKLKDAEEDKRLMKEYQERLDRQEKGGECFLIFVLETGVLPPRELQSHLIGNAFGAEPS